MQHHNPQTRPPRYLRRHFQLRLSWPESTVCWRVCWCVVHKTLLFGSLFVGPSSFWPGCELQYSAAHASVAATHAVSAGAVSGSAAHADEANATTAKAASFRDRVVDLVILKDQTRLYGSVTETDDAGTATLLVRAHWLQEALPNFFQQHIATALNQPHPQDPTLLSVINRLQQEVAELEVQPEPPRQKIGLLREALGRMTDHDLEPPQLIRLRIPKLQLHRVQQQSAQRKQLGWMAVLNLVPQCETAPWQAVARHLTQIPTAALSMSVAPSSPHLAGPQNALAHAAMPDPAEAVLSAIDLQANTYLKLVRSGSSFFPEDQQPDLATLLTPLLNGQLQQQLDSLLGPEFSGLTGLPNQVGAAAAPENTAELPAAAQQLAAQRNVRTAVVSDFQFDINTGQVEVGRRVYRKNNQGRWPVTMATMGRASTSQLTQEQKDVVVNDPQVKAIVNSLGAIAGTQQLQTALHMGAAIRIAGDDAAQALQNQATSLTSGQLSPTGGLRILDVTLTAE